MKSSSRTYLTFLIWALVLFCGHQAFGNGISPTVLILPKGPGSIGGVGENVKANLNMGLMSYSIPLKMPSGRVGATPRLSVTYSSAGGSSVMGIGWKLSGVGSVERLTVRGLPRYGKIQDPALTGEDRFDSSMGELVKIPNTDFYRVRYEGGFVRFRWHQNSDQAGYWTAEYPNGSIGFYGASYTSNPQRKVDVTQGKVDLESHVRGPLGTFRWRLRSMVDPHGNRIEYTYFRDGNQLYLSTISWVFSKSGEPLYKAEVEYEDRSDPIFNGKPGFACTTTKRVKSVKIFSTGQPFRSYSFAYDTTSRLSRLTKVTEFGTDGKIAFPVRFTMKYSSADYDPKQTMFRKLDQSVAQDFTTGNSDLIDMNGDGLPDIVDTSKPKHTFHFNTMTVKALQQEKHNFSAPASNPENTSAQLSNDQVQMLDFNGDGFTDMVDAVNKKIYINKGQGKWEDQSAALLGEFPNPSSKAPNRRFFDYNGDKAIDVIEINGSDVTYWVSNGKGKWTQVAGKQSLGADFAKDKLRLIDLNGDGLFDAVQFFGGKLRYRTYFGYGQWSDWINVKIEGLTQSLTDRARFRDINGDGLADMVAFVANSVKFFVNLNGTEFAAGEELNAKFKGIDIPDSDPTKVTIRIADLNGNGSRDIVWLDSSGNVTYLELFSQRPNLLTSIDNGIGKRIEVSYGSSVYHYLRDKAAGKAWPSKLPTPFIVVNQIKTWASLDGKDPNKGCPEIQQIAYHDGYYDGEEKKFRGFRRVESTFVGDQGPHCPTSLGQRTEMLRFYVGDGDTASGDNDRYYHGKMIDSTTIGSDGDGKIITFHSKKQEWGECSLTGVDKGLTPPVRYVCLKAEETVLKEGQKEDKWKTLRTEYEYDGFGNVILTKELGDKDAKGDEKFTKETFTTPKASEVNDPTRRWFLRAIVQRQICEVLEGPCATQDFFYDGEAFKGLPAGQITRGLLTRSSAKPKEGAKAIELTRSEYDAYGNIIGSKSPNGHLKTAEWDDTYHRFPVKETLHLKEYKLTATSTWDFRFSTVSQSTNWNGHTTLYGYDLFGRLTSMARPGDSAEKPSETFTYKLAAPISTIVVRKRSKQGGELDTTMIQCFDGMGRKLQVRTQVADGQYVVTKHVVYNSASLEARAYNSYASSDEACSFAAPDSVPFAESHYDGLRRLVKKIDQDKGVRSTQYLPLAQISHDQEDNRKDSPHFGTPVTTEADGLGRTIKQIEFTKPGSPVTTTYKWSLLNIYGRSIMRSTTDQGSQKKVQEIDYLGRVTKIEDPDRKSLSYVFDDNGNLLKFTDARGITMVYTYDELNRTVTLQQEGKDETRIQYHYDRAFGTFVNATNLKAELAGVTYPGGQEVFGYNKRGRLAHHRRTMLGVDFDFANEYDNLNRLIKRTYPDGRSLTYTYDGAERLTSIKGMVKSLSYGDDGKIKGWTLENGVTTTLSFSPRYLLKRIAVGDGKVMAFDYNYDQTANILSINKQMGDTSEEHRYQYDAMYRLTQASIGTKETLKYAYSANNNILSKTSSLEAKSPAHVGSYEYDKAHPRAVVKAGQMTLKYDQAGSVVNSQSLKYQLDFLGRRTAVLVGDQERGRNWYDGMMFRLIKQEDGRHTLYVGGDYEIRDGVAVIYARLNKMRLAAWKSTAFAATLYDDLAPAKGDGKITAADAWLYNVAKNNGDKGLIKRPLNASLVKDMLSASLASMMSDGKEEKVYFHTDHLGSTIATTDANGAVIGRKAYYPFGAIRSQTGHVFSYGYMGTELDRLTLENYAHHRFLDTRLGRWKSADPAFDRIRGTNDEFNSYGYVLNNPIRYRDSSGTEADEGPTNVEIGMGITVLTGGAIGVAFSAALEVRKWNKQNAGKHTVRAANVTKMIAIAGAGAAGFGFVMTGDDGAKWAAVGFTLLGGLASIIKDGREHWTQKKDWTKIQREKSERNNLRNSNNRLQRSNSNLRRSNNRLKRSNSAFRKQNFSLLRKQVSRKLSGIFRARRNQTAGNRTSQRGSRRSMRRSSKGK